MSDIRQTLITPSIEIPLEALRVFCQKWHITEFALFGSVIREDFNASSDIDVLISFQDGMRPNLTGWTEMGNQLEALFGRKVDLITRRSVEDSANYLRRKIILNSAQVIYAE